MTTASGSAGSVLRLVREQKGLSLGKLSYKTNIPKQTLSQWELGQRAIDADTFVDLIKAMGGKVTVIV